MPSLSETLAAAIANGEADAEVKTTRPDPSGASVEANQTVNYFCQLSEDHHEKILQLTLLPTDGYLLADEAKARLIELLRGEKLGAGRDFDIDESHGYTIQLYPTAIKALCSYFAEQKLKSDDHGNAFFLLKRYEKIFYWNTLNDEQKLVNKIINDSSKYYYFEQQGDKWLLKNRNEVDGEYYYNEQRLWLLMKCFQGVEIDYEMRKANPYGDTAILFDEDNFQKIRDFVAGTLKPVRVGSDIHLGARLLTGDADANVVNIFTATNRQALSQMVRIEQSRGNKDWNYDGNTPGLVTLTLGKKGTSPRQYYIDQRRHCVSTRLTDDKAVEQLVQISETIKKAHNKNPSKPSPIVGVEVFDSEDNLERLAKLTKAYLDKGYAVRPESHINQDDFKEALEMHLGDRYVRQYEDNLEKLQLKTPSYHTRLSGR